MSRSQIIDDIQSQAEAEVESIKSQRDSTLTQRRKALEEKLAEISDEADRKINEEEQRVQSRWARYLAQEERRIRLVLQDRVVNTVEERVQTDLKSLPESSEYAGLIRDWIIEAAIGLGYGTGDEENSSPRTGARIRCNPQDRDLIEKQIPEIQKRFLALTGQSLKLHFDKENLSSTDIGIVLVAESGRTAFSNTLADRFRRSSPEIHRIVLEKIFPGRTE